jgi:hypothetical protein
MVHVGEAEFFETVYADAFSHDVALVEGINSPIANRITRSYRWIGASETHDLVVQPSYPDQSDCHAKIVQTDLSTEEFAKLWCTIPLWLRLTVYAVAPLFGLWLRWFGSRGTLAENMTLDDLPRRDEILSFGPETAALHRVLLDARDAKLLERICDYIESSEPNVRRLSVVYGANHMRAVLRELKNRHGYQVRHSEW